MALRGVLKPREVDAVDAVLDHFRVRHAKDTPREKFIADLARRRLVEARLATHSVEELQRATENIERSPRAFWSDHRRVACVFRDADTVDELLALRPLPKAREPRPVVEETPALPPLTLEERRQRAKQLETMFGVPSRLE